ncbi:MAG TPA: AraC family transcriptional regulator [Rhizomicrobium sp.]
MTPRTTNMIRRINAPTVAAGFARALMTLAVSKGADAKLLAARAGLDPAQLEDQDARVPLANYIALMRAGQALSGDGALALHFGEAFDIDALSIVGLIGRAAETIGDAFAQLGRYERLIADIDGQPIDGPGPRLVVSREKGKTWLVDTRDNPNEFPEFTESGFARMVCSARQFGTTPFIREVHFTHKAPQWRAEYDRIFAMPVTFEAPRNALLMAGDGWLALKNPSPSRYAFGLLSERADALLKSLQTATTARGRVESLLMPILHTGETGMDTLAAKLGMTRQTLLRRLKEEGTTYAQVLDELRHRLALDYLAGKKVSVNETAYLVGFSDPAAFSRAFKRWEGRSPKEVRSEKVESDRS